MGKREISRLLNRPRPKLVTLRGRENLKARDATIDKNPKPWTPTERRKLEAQKVILPGEKCASCVIRSKKRHVRKRPHRFHLHIGFTL